MSISPLKTSFIVSLVFFMGIATASHAQATKPAPPTPIDEKKVELGGKPWNPQWDQIIEKALPPEMLSSQVPQGVRRFCPRFYEMGETDKRAFWAYFFQALAGAEAGLNPNTSVRHTKPEVAKRDEGRGLAMRGEGLLQLAYADQKRYGCDFNWQVEPYAKGERSGQNHSPAKEQSRMWSEDSGQPDHRPAQTLADPVGILVDLAAGRAELPCIREADDKPPGCIWSVHQVDDGQVGYNEVRAGRRDPG